MAKRRRRTSIRTASGTAQKQYLGRLRDLRDDPLRVVPEPVGPEPRPIARIRKRLERIKRKGPGFFDRRDKGVVGAVAQALPLAEAEAVPRLLDHKVAGQRKFYTVRGHATRNCAIGVQNHDDPRALLLAYHELAKKEGLHFFAVPRLWCTGATPVPPPEWIEALAKKGDITLTPDDDGWGCPHADKARLALRFRGGPRLAACGACGKRAGNLHKIVTARYAGPRTRQPVDVEVLLPDGSTQEPDSKDVAAYRADVQAEAELIAKGAQAWRKETRQQTDEIRFVLGEKAHGGDQERFLDALAPEPWERTALAAMTAKGHASGATTVAGVLKAIPDQIPVGVEALLGSGTGVDFVRAHRRDAPRDILRKAHEEAERRARVADLPRLQGLGPVGSWLDGTVRAVRGQGKQAAVRRVQQALDDGTVGPQHAWAVLAALGGDMATEARIPPDAKRSGEGLVPLAKGLMEASGDAYRDALAGYLQQAGTGEQVPGKEAG